MYTRNVRPAILLLTCTALAACAALGADPVKLTANEAGSTTHVKQGSTVDVELEGNPTTGYTWEVVSDGNGVLQQQGEAEFKADTSALGSGGIMTLHFKAAKAGTADLKLIYHRTFEPNVPPLQTFEATVVVD